MNITDSFIKKTCFECSNCINLCPVNAISYDQKENLSIELTVDEKKCVQCNLCVNICPSYNSLMQFGYFEPNLIGQYENLYYGYAQDKEMRSFAASGGAISSTVRFLIEEKVVDYAILTKLKITKENIDVISSYVQSSNELLDYFGSVYLQSKPNELINNKFINSNQKTVFVGLPCQIQGINLLKKIYPQLKNRIITLGLFCGRNANKDIWSYIVKKAKVNPSEIQEFHFRSNGWPGATSINGKQYPYRELFLIPWKNSWFYQKGCLFCQDVFADFADISFGDTWLPELVKENSEGYSTVITRTDIGKNIISRMKNLNLLHINDISEDKVLQSQSFQVKRKILYFAYSNRKLKKTGVHFRKEEYHLNTKQKIQMNMINIMNWSSRKRFTRTVLELLPLRFWKYMQNILR